jgi:hypothetical protein
VIQLSKFARSEFYSHGCFWQALVLIACSPATAAEQRSGHSLEDYLKRLGYQPIPLRRDHGNHLMVDGQIDAKNHDFMVDTGCTLTIVDNSIARKLKTLKTLGVQLQDSYFGTITNADTRVMTVKLGSAIFTNQRADSKHSILGVIWTQIVCSGATFYSGTFVSSTAPAKSFMSVPLNRRGKQGRPWTRAFAAAAFRR